MSKTSQFSQRAALAAGQPISELMSRALANPDLISLAAGFVDQATLPNEPTQIALDAIFANPIQARAALQYGTTPGYPPLREALLAQAVEQDSLPHNDLTIDQVIVTAGSNQLLHLISEILLNPGDVVLCAAPTYLVFLGTLGNIGARSVAVATDDDGMIPEGLDEALKRFDAAGELERVKAIYLVPYFDNPCGITMPAQRREQIVEMAKRWSRRDKIYVIEDSAYRQLRYWGDDIPGARTFDKEGDTVIVAGSFSKSFSPGVRVGWGILPRELVAPVCDMKGNIDFGSPNFNQHLLAKIMELDLFQPHVERIRQNYRTKLEAMLAASDEFLAPIAGVRWLKPTGGLYVWLLLPEQIDAGPDGPLLDAALAEDVLYVPGQYCFPAEGEPVQRNTIRLSFGVQSCEKIRTGIKALARAITKVASG